MIINTKKGGGKETVTWHQCPEAVRNYLANVTYSPLDYTTSQIASYAPTSPVESDTKPIGKTVDGATYYNEVPNVETPFSSANTAGTLKPLDRLRWLNTNSLTWTTGVDNFESKSALNSFVASAQIIPNRKIFRVYPDETRGDQRVFYIYEDEEIKFFSMYDVGYNVRDMGGWACDGGTIKYGMLIRGGETNPADKELMVNEIGIRTELRLFETSIQGLAHSVWDVDMLLNPTNLTPLTIPFNNILWRYIFEGVFDSVAHNKPVYLHCGQGADRTGCTAAMLEAILGMSESDISKDYEITSFSGSLRTRNSTDFTAFISAIKGVTLAGGLSDTFRNRAVSYAVSLGITINEINAYRNACIDGNPEQITILLDTFSVTKSGDTADIVFSNSDTSVNEFQGYTCDISALYGCAISSIVIKMGGVDITDSVFSGTETIVKYPIAKTLNDSTSVNNNTRVTQNDSYATIITPTENNTITAITVSMDGVDITESAVILFE